MQSVKSMGVEKSAYRQPVTPQGLKGIEKGTLTWLDDDMYNNLNTGVLENIWRKKTLKNPLKYRIGALLKSSMESLLEQYFLV